MKKLMLPSLFFAVQFACAAEFDVNSLLSQPLESLSQRFKEMDCSKVEAEYDILDGELRRLQKEIKGYKDNLLVNERKLNSLVGNDGYKRQIEDALAKIEEDLNKRATAFTSLEGQAISQFYMDNARLYLDDQSHDAYEKFVNRLSQSSGIEKTKILCHPSVNTIESVKALYLPLKHSVVDNSGAIESHKGEIASFNNSLSFLEARKKSLLSLFELYEKFLNENWK